jgi:hypothetical protein
MCDFKYQGYQAVELRITGVASTGQTIQTWSFGDLPYLRPNRAQIVGIEIISANSITGGPITGTTVATVAQMKTASLTLYSYGTELVQKIPLFKLNVLQNASTDPFARDIFKLDSLGIDWTKSFVSFNAAPGNTTDVVIPFGVYYNQISLN